MSICSAASRGFFQRSPVRRPRRSCQSGRVQTRTTNPPSPSGHRRRMGFAPFRVVLTADVKGGPDDYEQYYCATIEWDMGDGNRAEQSADCDPYEAGKSQIKRRYVREQVFDTPASSRHVPAEAEEQGRRHGPDHHPRRPGLRDIGGDDR